jgi:hypothetical protein
MRIRYLPLLVVAIALAGCGAREQAGTPAATAAAPAARLPVTSVLERRLRNSFRAGLRRLSLATGVAGDTDDIGQAVATGLVERVRCGSASTTGARCVVSWADIRGRRHLTSYRVAGAHACFSALADPALTDVKDLTLGVSTENPLQELEGASPC